MNGSPFIVLDTNVVLYHLGDRLKQPLEKRQYVISVITEIELLSYPKIGIEETVKIQNFLARTTVVGLLESIKIETIRLRRKYALKTPDAIIAARALKLNALLLTRDKKLLSVSEIKTQEVEIENIYLCLW